MCGIVFGIITLVLGVALVITSTIVGYVVIPDVIDSRIINEMTLINDTIQLERFETVPFPLNFTIRFFNISNVNDVLIGGVPIVNEVGPYIYKIHKSRAIEELDGDIIRYRLLDIFEFDPVGSYPNTEDDIVSIANVAYHPPKIKLSSNKLIETCLRSTISQIRLTSIAALSIENPTAESLDLSNKKARKVMF